MNIKRTYGLSGFLMLLVGVIFFAFQMYYYYKSGHFTKLTGLSAALFTMGLVLSLHVIIIKTRDKILTVSHPLHPFKRKEVYSIDRIIKIELKDRGLKMLLSKMVITFRDEETNMLLTDEFYNWGGREMLWRLQKDLPDIYISVE